MEKIKQIPKAYLKKFWLGLLLAGTLQVSSQTIGPSLINATGGSATVGGNSYEWSVGEMVVSTYTSSTLVVTQGELQSGPGVPIGIKDENTLPDSKLLVYPNPAEDQLFLRPDLKPGYKLSYVLYDISGHLILQADLALSTGKELQSLTVNQLAIGEYILQVQVKNADQVQHAAYRIQKK